jgi:hypothetical protein
LERYFSASTCKLRPNERSLVALRNPSNLKDQCSSVSLILVPTKYLYSADQPISSVTTRTFTHSSRRKPLGATLLDVSDQRTRSLQRSLQRPSPRLPLIGAVPGARWYSRMPRVHTRPLRVLPYGKRLAWGSLLVGSGQVAYSVSLAKSNTFRSIRYPGCRVVEQIALFSSHGC